MGSKRHCWSAVQALSILHVVLLGTACPRATPPPAPPPPAGCEDHKVGTNEVRDVAVQADVSGKHFTLEASALLGVGPQGGSHGSEARMTVTRDAAVVVQVESHLSTDGKIQVHLQVGAGFSGPKDYAFTVADQKTLQGTIDGKPIAPLSLGRKIESPRYADGTPIPATQLDNDVKEALPLLARMAQEECPKVAPPQGGGGAPAPAPV